MHGLVAVVFNGTHAARDALVALEDRKPKLVRIEDIAVLSKSVSGEVHVQCASVQDGGKTPSDSCWGVVTSSLVGAVLGQRELLAGEVRRTSLGPFGGAVESLDMRNPALSAMATAIGKETSALFLVGKERTLDELVSGTGSLGGRIIRGDLTAKEINALRAEVG